jgi:hypothetical protein
MALPPDLSRLGDELAAAAARSLERRRRQTALLVRGGATLLAAALAFAVLAPAALRTDQPAPAGLDHLRANGSAEQYSVPTGCDQPRGLRFGLPACDTTLATDRGIERAPMPVRFPRLPA